MGYIWRWGHSDVYATHMTHVYGVQSALTWFGSCLTRSGHLCTFTMVRMDIHPFYLLLPVVHSSIPHPIFICPSTHILIDGGHFSAVFWSSISSTCFLHMWCFHCCLKYFDKQILILWLTKYLRVVTYRVMCFMCFLLSNFIIFPKKSPHTYLILWQAILNPLL